MKTAKLSAPVVGKRLRRTLGALLAIGFASTWWKFVPTKESAAAPIDPPVARVHSVPANAQFVVIAIPVVIPFALPTAPPPPAPRLRKRVVHTQIALVDAPPRQPFALPPPPEVPTPPDVDDPVIEQEPELDPEPHIRTRSS
jgi:hypothetical protein